MSIEDKILPDQENQDVSSVDTTSSQNEGENKEVDLEKLKERRNFLVSTAIEKTENKDLKETLQNIKDQIVNNSEENIKVTISGTEIYIHRGDTINVRNEGNGFFVNYKGDFETYEYSKGLETNESNLITEIQESEEIATEEVLSEEEKQVIEDSKNEIVETIIHLKDVISNTGRTELEEKITSLEAKAQNIKNKEDLEKYKEELEEINKSVFKGGGSGETPNTTEETVTEETQKEESTEEMEEISKFETELARFDDETREEMEEIKKGIDKKEVDKLWEEFVGAKIFYRISSDFKNNADYSAIYSKYKSPFEEAAKTDDVEKCQEIITDFKQELQDKADELGIDLWKEDNDIKEEKEEIQEESNETKEAKELDPKLQALLDEADFLLEKIKTAGIDEDMENDLDLALMSLKNFTEDKNEEIEDRVKKIESILGISHEEIEENQENESSEEQKEAIWDRGEIQERFRELQKETEEAVSKERKELEEIKERIAQKDKKLREIEERIGEKIRNGEEISEEDSNEIAELKESINKDFFELQTKYAFTLTSEATALKSSVFSEERDPENGGALSNEQHENIYKAFQEEKVGIELMLREIDRRTGLALSTEKAINSFAETASEQVKSKKEIRKEEAREKAEEIKKNTEEIKARSEAKKQEKDAEKANKKEQRKGMSIGKKVFSYIPVVGKSAFSKETPNSSEELENENSSETDSEVTEINYVKLNEVEIDEKIKEIKSSFEEAHSFSEEIDINSLREEMRDIFLMQEGEEKNENWKDFENKVTKNQTDLEEKIAKLNSLIGYSPEEVVNKIGSDRLFENANTNMYNIINELNDILKKEMPKLRLSKSTEEILEETPEPEIDLLEIDTKEESKIEKLEEEIKDSYEYLVNNVDILAKTFIPKELKTEKTKKGLLDVLGGIEEQNKSFISLLEEKTEEEVEQIKKEINPIIEKIKKEKGIIERDITVEILADFIKDLVL